MIWRFSFPRGRDVMLDLSLIEPPEIGSYCGREASVRAHEIESRRPNPASLYVNEKSRNEALKHYCVSARPKSTHTSKRHRPFCYNPILDTGYISYHSLSNEWISQRAFDSFLKFRVDAPQVFSWIRSLEVRDWHWYPVTIESLALGRRCIATLPLLLETLFPLSELREVTIVLAKGYGSAIERLYDVSFPVQSNPMDGKKQIVDEVTAVLESRKAESKWNHGVPKVYVKFWSKLRA
ncbi:hypothetical protein DL98DRAFT_654373 [Cadophora sp. DSE1049]|nr:hypothetical protein DL98DRAFT_654373 [Cadophora sp. DSE1049]